MFKRNILQGCFFDPLRTFTLALVHIISGIRSCEAGVGIGKETPTLQTSVVVFRPRAGGKAVPVGQPLLQIAVGLLSMPALIMWASR